MHTAISWFTKNPVAANLLMFVLVVGGILSLLTVHQEEFPSMDIRMVTVSVPYLGAAPEEVEQGIVLAIEEAVRGLDGVDEVTSSSREGIGVVNIDLLLGAVLRQRGLEVGHRLEVALGEVVRRCPIEERLRSGVAVSDALRR